MLEPRECFVCSDLYQPRRSNQMTCGLPCRYALELSYQQDWRPANKARIDAMPSRVAYRAGAYRPQRVAQARAWRAAHPQETRERKARYRAQALGREIRRITTRDLTRLAARYDRCCGYCGRAMVGFDHIVPLTRGGRHAIGNLIPACGSCNSRKHTRLLIEWRGLRAAA